MTRLLILIFAFNAFMLPASATMNAPVNMLMNNSASSTTALSSMADMDCKMADCDMSNNGACSAVGCIHNCAASVTSIILSKYLITFNVAGNLQLTQADLVYFYTIVHPIHTPPPLV